MSRPSLPLPLWVAIRYLKTRRKQFAAFITWVSLLGLALGVLVLFNADNGPETNHVAWMREDEDHDAAGGWRGVKRDGWEGGHRVPFIARWPGRIPRGQVSNQVTNTTDIFATLASVVGYELSDDAATDSFDVLPAMLDNVRNTGRTAVDISFPEVEKFDNLPEPGAQGPTAFVSVMEGCSKYCSFCVVPYTRGEEVSRPLDDVIAEIAGLADQGVREHAVTTVEPTVRAPDERVERLVRVLIAESVQ